ncbi:MAG: class I SAM-dependent methyltransferase [Myxococcales bacterium]|nr:class I SAM-dependent methyltransferase [Myxococcales bacterium]
MITAQSAQAAHPAAVEDFRFDALGANDAAIVETFAVPRYLAWFGELALEMLLVSEAARVAHLGCRTGYPDLEILKRIPRTALVGVDGSEPALDLARNKAAAAGITALEYQLATGLPTGLPAEQFSHALCLHPRADRLGRVALFGEMQRLLYRGGQALLALPLSSSFRELTDLLAEYALKYDDSTLSDALEHASTERITIEGLALELEQAGLGDVDFEVRQRSLRFDSGRALVEDPATRFFILPELEGWLGAVDLTEPSRYFVEAIDKYWSEDPIELGVTLVAVSARKG